MNQLKQKRVLLIIIAILLLANIFTLAIMFTQKTSYKKDVRNSRKDNMVTYLKNDLKYNEGQLSSFDTIYKRHMENTNELYKEMKAEKEDRFNFLTGSAFSDSAISIAANTMAEKHKILEIKVLSYLKEVRGIGDSGQQKKFDSTFSTFMKKIKRRKK